MIPKGYIEGANNEMVFVGAAGTEPVPPRWWVLRNRAVVIEDEWMTWAGDRGTTERVATGRKRLHVNGHLITRHADVVIAGDYPRHLIWSPSFEDPTWGHLYDHPYGSEVCGSVPCSLSGSTDDNAYRAEG